MTPTVARIVLTSVLAVSVLALTVSGQTAAVDAERLALQRNSAGEWLTHGRTYAEERFSPLDSINVENVGELGLAWSYELSTKRGQEATPIVVDGVMYFTGAWSQVFALNAATGELIWQYDPVVPRAWAKYACCDVVNRGVAVWGEKIFFGTLDGRLIALDAATGKPAWEVMTVDSDHAYTITGAPRVVKGRALIGNGGAEFGVRGYISAYDVDTGEQAWRFHTVPGNPDEGYEFAAIEMAAETWTGEWWKIGGGGTVWDSMAYDADLDLLYIGVGNGSPWNRELRSPGGGDNLFLSSIVALRPDTGEYVWHYQTTPAENWDYTATQHIILADIEIDGRLRQVLMQAPKNGFFYVIDRGTGEFISAENYVPVNWASHINPETGRPVEAIDNAYHEQPRLTLPSPIGGHNWMPMAYSPITGLVYIPAIDVPHTYGGDATYPRPEAYWQTGTDTSLAPPPIDVGPRLERSLLRKLASARLIAWDPVQQKEIWRVPHAHPWNGGVLATAGNLVFQGDAAGLFSAYRSDTGERLWQQPANTGTVAAPISYSIEGEQYVAVLAGWGGSGPLFIGTLNEKGRGGVTGRMLVYKLGAAAQPPSGSIPVRPLEKPQRRENLTAAALDKGFILYSRHCAVCHGFGVVGGGVLPDLRHMRPATWEIFDMIVGQGVLEPAGMPSFRGRLDAQDLAAIRAYISREAHREWEDENDPTWWRSVKTTTAVASAWVLALLQ